MMFITKLIPKNFGQEIELQGQMIITINLLKISISLLIMMMFCALLILHINIITIVHN